MGKTIISLTLFGFGLICGVIGALFLIDIRHGLNHGDGWATALATIALVAVGIADDVGALGAYRRFQYVG